MKTPVQDLETFSDNALMLKVKDGHLDKLGRFRALSVVWLQDYGMSRGCRTE